MAARRYKWPWYVHFFNISSFAIAAGLAAAIYHALTHIAHADSFAVMMSIVTAVAAFTLFNHTHVAGVLWLSERVTPAKSGLFASSSLLVDASLLGVGALCALIAPMNPFAIVLGAAPLYLIHSALRIPRLERKAKTDAKTGLYHSHHFAQRAEQEFERAKRLNRPLSLVMIDLDLLRDVNNTHGHLGGDVAIQTVAKALREHALEDDVVARFGGEEFVGLFVECDLTTAAERAEKIRKAIETAMPVLPNGQTFKVTASLGLAQCDRTDANLAALIGRADEALYAAKHEGRNCLRMHKKHGFAPTTPRLYRADETAALCVIPMRKGEMFK
jgi:diguanylate cyclase (GGDEF)-like protein